jgi:hypothetical protein
LFATTALTAHSSRLQSLSLAIPLEGYSQILTAAPLLESLEYLSITLKIVYHATVHEETSLIAAFINRHSRSLQNLSVHMSDPIVNPYHIFHNLGQPPRLKKLSICHPIEHRQQYPLGIDSFFMKQADSFIEVNICFPTHLHHGLQSSATELFPRPALQMQLAVYQI